MHARRSVALAAAAVLLALPCAGASGTEDLEARRARRRAEAEEAAREIRATHFFADGRGLHGLPGLGGLLRAGSVVAPGLVRETLRDRLGLVLDAEGVVGLHHPRMGGARVPVAGCAACHAGRAAGRTYVGLGNKNIDVGAVGRTVLGLAPVYRLSRPLLSPVERRTIDQALATARMLADPSRVNATQGLVPVGNVARWFYVVQGLSYPGPKGAVKVPHLWGYGAKREAGLFCDGVGDGSNEGWGGMIEAAAGQHPETIRAYQPRMAHVEELFERLLPPRYPFALDPAAARRGAEVFAEQCAACHGAYRRDGEGFPVFEPPAHVPIAAVGTDDDRLGVVTPAFRKVAAASPLRDLVRLTDLPRGYFAPRLDGIWARFPYLHNGSVPTLRALLTPPEARPRAWSLHQAGEAWRFDPVHVGLTLPDPRSAEEHRLVQRGRRGGRDVYLTERTGQSSRGHPFGTDLPDEDKRALLEFLKGL